MQELHEPLSYPLPENEKERLAELQRLCILGTPAEADFDQLVRLAAEILQCPIAFLSFIDQDRQWLKAKTGLEIAATPREHAFCNYTILGKEVLVVEDVVSDQRYRTNPYVVGEPKIRFYAGVPVASSGGLNVGSLCLIDTKPKTVSVEQRGALKTLGALASSLLQRRQAGLHTRELAEELEASRHLLSEQSQELRRKTQLLGAATAIAKLGAWEVDGSTGQISWSDDMYILHDIAPGTPIYPEQLLNLYPDQRRQVRKLVRRYLEGGVPFVFEGEMLTAAGCRKWVRVTAEVERTDAGIRYFGTKQDISQEKASIDAAKRASEEDALTSLPNRRALLRYLRAAVRRPRPAALFLLDLDGFKDINDVHGHSAGDYCIRVTASRLADALTPSSSFLARLGGDEFAVVTTDVAEKEQLGQLAEKIVEVVAKPIRWRGVNFQISTSVGIAYRAGVGSSSSTELMRQADLALYKSKASGRNCSSFFHPNLKIASEKRAATISAVRDALERGELELFYQARLPLAARKPGGFEALLRWRSPSGLKTPDAFRDALDDPLLSILIGDFVLEEALDQATRWREQGFKFGLISINIGAGQFRQPTLGLKIIQAVLKRGLLPEMIEVEITEDVLLSRSGDVILDICHGLREFGIGVAFDDFGTGFASLTHLLDLPISTLKIDRTFIQRLDTDQATKSVVAAICRLGRDLSLEVVAEGVETAKQLDILRELDCDFVQGYLFHRPAPAGDCMLLKVDPQRSSVGCATLDEAKRIGATGWLTKPVTSSDLINVVEQVLPN